MTKEAIVRGEIRYHPRIQRVTFDHETAAVLCVRWPFFKNFYNTGKKKEKKKRKEMKKKKKKKHK